MRFAFSKLLLAITCAVSPAIGQAGDLEKLPIDFGLADGAAWDGGRTLFVPDVKGGVLWQINTNNPKQKPIKRLEGAWSISGTYFQNGTLHFVDGKKRQLMTMSRSGQPSTVAAFAEGQRPNDLVVTIDGDAYITFTKEGVVRRVTPDGSISVVVDDLVTPNGIALRPDQRAIYVSSIKNGQIRQFPISVGDSVVASQPYAQLPETEKGFQGDGMTIDRAGRLYCTGSQSVVIFGTDGTILDEIQTPARPINAIFADNDARRLYISTFDGVYSTLRNAYGVVPMKALVNDGVSRDSNITYAQIEGRSLLMDVYRSDQSSAIASPAIVLVHGGGWLKGSKEKFSTLATSLAKLGYVVAAIEYRLGYEAKFPAGIKDCNAATAWLRWQSDRWNVDPNRIAAVGGSAGGHLVGLMAAGDEVGELKHASQNGSSELQAAVVMAGPMEMVSGSVARRSAPGGPPSNAMVWIGDHREALPDAYALADAMTKIDSTMPPSLFICGSEDTPSRNEPSRQRMRNLGVHTELSVQAGARHGHWNSPEYMSSVVQAIDAFLQRHMPAPSDSK